MLPSFKSFYNIAKLIIIHFILDSNRLFFQKKKLPHMINLDYLMSDKK